MILCDHCGQKATQKDYLIQFPHSPALASFDLCDKCKADLEKKITRTITSWKEEGKDAPQPHELPQASRGLQPPWRAAQGDDAVDPEGKHTPAHRMETIPSGIPLPGHEQTPLAEMGVRRPASEQGAQPPTWRGDKPHLDPKNPEAAERETREVRAARLEAEQREAKARKDEDERQDRERQQKLAQQHQQEQSKQQDQKSQPKKGHSDK
jgi:hypothetical protein